MIVLLVFLIATIKVFKDVMWVIFVMNCLGSMTLAFTFSMFKEAKVLAIKHTWPLKTFQVICISVYTTLLLFAFVPPLSHLYGEKPVYDCEDNLYPWVFPFLMAFNAFIAILNLSTYYNHSKKLKKAIA